MPQRIQENLIYAPGQVGSGRPSLFFIHGVLHGAWCWEPAFIPFFTRAGYDCYAIDLPGHGQCRVPNINRLRFRDYASTLQEVIGQLPEPPVLVGHSMGGLLVQAIMERLQPRGCILLAPLPGKGIGPSAWRMLRHDPVGFMHALLTLDMSKAFQSEPQVRWAMYSEHVNKAELDGYRQKMGSESFLAFLEMLWPRVRFSVPNRIPTLLLAAGQDRLISMADWITTAHYLGATLHTVEEAPHNLMLDPCWPRVAERMHTWLKDTFDEPTRKA